MSDQPQLSTEPAVLSENPELTSDNTEAAEKNETNLSEQRTAGRASMPQDIRYCTEQDDRLKLTEKYNQYQVSDVNACSVRFLADNRQRKSLFGHNDEERSNVQSLAKTFRVNVFPGYQQATKHSYKLFGTETDVRKCLVEVMERMFKRSNQWRRRDQHETAANSQKPEESDVSTGKGDDDQTPHPISPVEEIKSIAPTGSESEETAPAQSSVTSSEKTVVSTDNEKSEDDARPQLTPISVTSINPDSSTTEEEKPIVSATPDLAQEPTETTDTFKSESVAKESTKFVPLERKPQWTFTMLIPSQGQEVLKKNWSFFGGSLQQRLDVVVTNPVKLSKFGDKQIQNELPITGESIENITDATLQIAAFINDVLGVPMQSYEFDEESIHYDQHPQNQTPSYQEGSPASDSQHSRISFNRNRNGAFEQLILIRSDCVPRIVGTRASNLKRIQAKCRLRDMLVGRQANENGYVECTLSAYQIRSIHFAINTIRNFLRNEDASAVLVNESHHGENSPHTHELVPPNTEQTPAESGHSSEETGFFPQNFHFSNNKPYPQPSYNFQNTPSFDFTHQATSASRKTDKRRGDLHDSGRTLNESHNSHYENLALNSPRQKSKRACPETKEIDCTTDEGFWVQKQHYYALDDASKQLFDSLIEKVEKIRIASEENASRKQQRLVGRNKCNKSKVYGSSISYLTEENKLYHKESTVKTTQIEKDDEVDQSTEEKENKQEPSNAVVVSQE